MSNDQPHPPVAAEVPPYVHLFQKAHQAIGLLEQVDEQLAELWSRRQQLQEDLRALQSQINDELQDRITAAGEPPKHILTTVAANAGNGEKIAPPPMASRAPASRFSNQALATDAEE